MRHLDHDRSGHRPTVSALLVMTALLILPTLAPVAARGLGIGDTICSQPPYHGPCDGECPRWYFNAELGECELFIWGCCIPGANHFDTLEECQGTCNTCLLPADPGPCDGVCPRWFFNPETGACEAFVWGCCGGNANKYETLEACQSACRLCELPPDPGPCDAVCPRWYYDTETGRCEQFTWGCCGGNANNFETLEECQKGCDRCPSDVDNDGDVGVNDLVAIIQAWGRTGGAADVNHDGVVDVEDLVRVIVDWGPCGG